MRARGQGDRKWGKKKMYYWVIAIGNGRLSPDLWKTCGMPTPRIICLLARRKAGAFIDQTHPILESLLLRAASPCRLSSLLCLEKGLVFQVGLCQCAREGLTVGAAAEIRGGLRAYQAPKSSYYNRKDIYLYVNEVYMCICVIHP